MTLLPYSTYLLKVMVSYESNRNLTAVDFKTVRYIPGTSVTDRKKDKESSYSIVTPYNNITAIKDSRPVIKV
jgi:hypothetical protein